MNDAPPPPPAARPSVRDRPTVAQTTIRVGPRAFLVPDDFLHSYSSDGLSIAVTWPSLEGAVGRNFPPKTVLEVRIGLVREPIAEQVERVRQRNAPATGPDPRHGLYRIPTGKQRAAEILFVDDPAHPTLELYHQREYGDPMDTFCSFTFEADGLRIGVSLFGAILPGWRPIRARLTALVATLQRP